MKELVQKRGGQILCTHSKRKEANEIGAENNKGRV